MNKICLLLLPVALFCSCQSGSTKHTEKTITVKPRETNVAFDQFADSFLHLLWRYEPEWATYVGYHDNDSLLSIPDDSTRLRYLHFAQEQLTRMQRFAPDSLNVSQRIDYYLIRNQLEQTVWSVTQLKSHEWDPSAYNPTGVLAYMLSEQYAPLAERLRQIDARIQQLPVFFKAAKASLTHPVPELTTLAISQLQGGLSVLEQDLSDSVKAVALPDSLKQRLLAHNKQAVQSIRDFVQFLTTKKFAAHRSFRLGKELYEQKFGYQIQSSLTAAQLYAKAVARKQELHGAMAKISRQLWPKYFKVETMPADTLELISRVLDTLSTNHVRPDEFQSAIEQQLPQLVTFIQDKNLLYFDESKPLVVRKEPAYMAGVAGASISAPGPYDQGGNTYYNVGSLNGWPAARAESYLREYNHYILQILNIHEAIPGHYTQLVYANRSPSLIKSVLGNGAMIEGWAVYTEQMMLENGYGGDEPEMWLMWYKWHLRTVCNTILDYNVHVLQMNKKEAMHLLTHEAFQQQAEAEGKWNRVNVTSVQLTSYYAGYQEIYDLREKLKQHDDFDLRVFHEKFLSYGSAPVKYIAAMMLSGVKEK